MITRVLEANQIRSMGMFSFAGDRIVNGIANTNRRRFLEGHTIDAETVLDCLRRLGKVEGYGEATDTVVKEAVLTFIEEGDKQLEQIDFTHEHCCSKIESKTDLVWYPWTMTELDYNNDDCAEWPASKAGYACHEGKTIQNLWDAGIIV